MYGSYCKAELYDPWTPSWQARLTNYYKLSMHTQIITFYVQSGFEHDVWQCLTMQVLYTSCRPPTYSLTKIQDFHTSKLNKTIYFCISQQLSLSVFYQLLSSIHISIHKIHCVLCVTMCGLHVLVWSATLTGLTWPEMCIESSCCLRPWVCFVGALRRWGLDESQWVLNYSQLFTKYPLQARQQPAFWLTWYLTINWQIEIAKDICPSGSPTCLTCQFVKKKIVQPKIILFIRLNPYFLLNQIVHWYCIH